MFLHVSQGILSVIFGEISWIDKLDADAAAVCHGQLLSADSQVWLFSCLLGVPHQRKFRKRG